MYWGTSTDDTRSQTIRPEFRGNEEFSHSNHKVNRKDVNNFGTFFMLVNVVVCGFFVAICVGTYFFSKQYISDSLINGIVNGAIIGATNFAYRKVAAPLTEMENHKGVEEFNSSFIKKLFIF